MVKRTLRLSLSSDAPDPRRLLARAVAELRRLPGVKVRKVSWVCGSAAVRCVSVRTPMGLLIELKRIEAILGLTMVTPANVRMKS